MITSLSNARVRSVIALKNKSKERSARDVFLVEGVKMFGEVPLSHLAEVFVSESFYNTYRDTDLIQRVPSCEIVADRVFAAMCDTRTPQGVICLVRQYHYKQMDLMGDGTRPPLVMALENLQDPGNLGTILRTAEGAGATGVLLSRGCVDIYNPKVIRSTMGTIYRVPFVYADNLDAALKEFRQQGIRLYAAYLSGSVEYDREDYRRGSVFLVGNESRGLTEQTAGLADARIRIPMCGQLESLNASVAASLLLYEAFRQRRGGT